MIGYAGLRTAKAARGAYAKLLAAGLTSLILCQALLNIYAVLGLAPLTGVPLPFISSGSTSLLVLLARWACCSTSPPAARRTLRAVRGNAKRRGRTVSGTADSDRGRRDGRARRARPSRWPTRCGLRARRSRSSAASAPRRELVPAAGYPLDPIRVEGVSRTQPAAALRAVAKAGARAARSAARILRERDADAVLGGGGYVAGPVGLAAVLRRVPLVLTEADSHLGLSNRLLAPRARRVCLAFPIAGRDGARYLVTGRPVPPRAAERGPARAALGIGADELLRAGLRRLARRPLDQPGGAWRRSPTRRTACCTSPAGATSASCARRGRTTTCAST